MYPGEQERNVKMKGEDGSCLQRLFVEIGRLNKTANRRRRLQTKEDDYKSSIGKNITEETIEKFREVAIEELDGIASYALEMFTERNAIDVATRKGVFSDLMLEKPALLKKWKINFLGLILVFENGQRNQVYTFLKAPSIADLELFDVEDNVP